MRALLLADDGKIALTLLNAILNYGLCLLGVALGFWLGSPSLWRGLIDLASVTNTQLHP